MPNQPHDNSFSTTEIRECLEFLADDVCRLVVSNHDASQAFADVFLVIVEAIVAEDHERGADALEVLAALVETNGSEPSPLSHVEQLRQVGSALQRHLEESMASLRESGESAASSGVMAADGIHSGLLLILSALSLFREDRVSCQRGLDVLSTATSSYPDIAAAVVIELFTSLALAKFRAGTLGQLSLTSNDSEPAAISLAVDVAELAPFLDLPAEELAWAARHILLPDRAKLWRDLSEDANLRFAIVVAGTVGSARLIREWPSTGEMAMSFCLALPMAVSLRLRLGTLEFGRSHSPR